MNNHPKETSPPQPASHENASATASDAPAIRFADREQARQAGARVLKKFANVFRKLAQ